MVIAIFLVFCTAALVGYAVVPDTYNRVINLSQQRAKKYSKKLDRVVSRKKMQQMAQLYMFAPLITGAAAYMICPPDIQIYGVVIGALLGFVFPGAYTKMLVSKNKRSFDDQLIDALMIMASSFRGGLSLIQAMEAVTDEMPDPIRQEFMTVLGENKMGVNLDEALTHLFYRMPSSALQQMNTAILLARETGGNLPAIFQRIVNVIREQRRIMGQIETLTIQGKIQGVVMSLLPVGFFMIIYSSNPAFFEHMFQSTIGRAMMIYAVVSEIVGAVLIWKISSFKDF